MRFATFTTSATSEPMLGVLVNDTTVINLSLIHISEPTRPY